jgi:hypothetical protein
VLFPVQFRFSWSLFFRMFRTLEMWNGLTLYQVLVLLWIVRWTAEGLPTKSESNQSVLHSACCRQWQWNIRQWSMWPGRTTAGSQNCRTPSLATPNITLSLWPRASRFVELWALSTVFAESKAVTLSGYSCHILTFYSSKIYRKIIQYSTGL